MSQMKHNFLCKLRSYFKSLPFDINGKRMCVCLSGGADSVSLLLGMKEIAVEFDIQIFACHFNHMLRGDESNRDEIFCKKLCEKLNIELFCGRDDVANYCKSKQKSIEEGARECRYAFFDRVKNKRSFDFYLTAHNMNDDVETLLFNLIRGSGSNGASSISPYNERMLRPLLKIQRFEIEHFLEDIDQDYIVDSTNSSIKYSRNFIRHKLLPVIKEVNPSAIETISSYIDSCREDRGYFDELVNEYYNDDLRNHHASLRKRIYIKKAKQIADYTKPKENTTADSQVDIFGSEQSRNNESKGCQIYGDQLITFALLQG